VSEITQYWVSRIVQEELEKVAKAFEGLPDTSWTGREAAKAIRLVIEQHAAMHPSPSDSLPITFGISEGKS
jgi:hypothetical protein